MKTASKKKAQATKREAWETRLLDNQTGIKRGMLIASKRLNYLSETDPSKADYASMADEVAGMASVLIHRISEARACQVALEAVSGRDT